MCQFNKILLQFYVLLAINFILNGFPNVVSPPSRCCDYDNSTCPIDKTDPNYQDLQSADLIRLFGYPAEEHDIITDDGYVLTVQRIPYSNASSGTSGKIPVFCMHGIFASSAQWFWQPANRALVFMLADAGYDVWIGNSRGTTYSQKHINMSNSNLEYWNFSSFELGRFDIPAVIKYILNVTSQPSLYYIGHSLGGQQFFIAMTLHPELNSKIRTMFALAPAVYTGNTTNLFFNTAAPIYAPYLSYLALNTVSGGKFSHDAVANILAGTAYQCVYAPVNCIICSNVYFTMFGYDPCQANYTTLPGLLAHIPDVISTKVQSHSAQAILTGKFSHYDYGYFLNMQRYKQATPPEYDWTKLNVPVVLFYGKNDNLVHPMDIKKLAGKLGSNLKEFIRVPFDCFDHLDFVAAKDADIYVYQPIINIMNNSTYG